MSQRTPPDDHDWTRRYLRQLKVPCEGEQLQAALDSLDGRAWRRLKDAWRQHGHRRYGRATHIIERECQAEKRFGTVWRRLMAWDVVTEEEAHLLASQPLGNVKSIKNLYGDVGACEVLRASLAPTLDRLGRQQADSAPGKLVNYVLSGIKLVGGPRPESLEEFAERMARASEEQTGKRLDIVDILGSHAQTVWTEAVRVLDEGED
jgi:hypothetical protein